MSASPLWSASRVKSHSRGSRIVSAASGASVHVNRHVESCAVSLRGAVRNCTCLGPQLCSEWWSRTTVHTCRHTSPYPPCHAWITVKLFPAFLKQGKSFDDTHDVPEHVDPKNHFFQRSVGTITIFSSVPEMSKPFPLLLRLAVWLKKGRLSTGATRHKTATRTRAQRLAIVVELLNIA